MSYWQEPDRVRQAEEQLASSANDILQRSGASIQRSNQIALETEQLGTEVLSELGEQRESLLRTTHRLDDANENLSKTRSIITRLRRDVLYNKIILIAIIVVEVLILAGLLNIKIFK